jgi:hypothetical protein
VNVADDSYDDDDDDDKDDNDDDAHSEDACERLLTRCACEEMLTGCSQGGACDAMFTRRRLLGDAHKTWRRYVQAAAQR